MAIRNTGSGWRPTALMGLVLALSGLGVGILYAEHKVDVIVDGRAIFQVSNSRELEAGERARTISDRINRLLTSGRPVKPVTVRQINENEWEIVSGDIHLLTVSELDGAEFQTPPEQLAKQWREALDKALIRSREQRREPILIDGQKLFTIGNTREVQAGERAAQINDRISSIVNDRLDVTVKAEQLEGFHTIRIRSGDQVLLTITITEDDAAQNQTTVEELANEWATLLQSGIERAKEQRTGKYLTHVAIKGGVAILGLVGFILFLNWLFRLLRQGLERIRERRTRSHIEIGSLALISLFLRLALQTLRILAILTTAYYILQQHPYTRRYVDVAMSGVGKAIDLISRAFVAELFKLGDASVSMKGILLVVIFIIMVFLIGGAVRRALEEKLFPQTSMDRGVQHSVATVTSYLVIIVGFVIGLQSAGINLSAFAVVAGAVGIGIGFGLQNIANNVVSGLIILFERPIQVGDRVEVGTINGDVVRINARSTTILTNDNIAMIVPNANFITSTVINWSHLGDRRVRFRIKVGVSYQSDVKLVKQSLLEAAAEHPEILKDPAPSVRFMRFGESAMEFELRVWTSRLSNRPGQVTSDMNFAILEKLKKYNIEIPHPQSDIHLRSVTPVELRIENLNELIAREKAPEEEIFKNLK